MKLFMVGWRRSGGADSQAGRDALQGMLGRLPYFDPATAETWEAPSGRVTLSCAGHEPERLGGVSYLEADDRGFGLFSGRPFHWTADDTADGRGPLDPAFYRRPPAEWADGLDGRCAAVRCDDEAGELDIYTDPLGSHPLYQGERGGTRWFSNSAELVRSAIGDDEVDILAAASVLGCGFSLRGNPIWNGVRRLPRGVVLRLRPGGETATELLPLSRIASLAGAGFDPARTAVTLVAATAALADWPGRPLLLQISGGRDSRLVLAAALKAGVEFEAVTSGPPNLPDVVVAKELCELVGTPHRRITPDPRGEISDRAGEATRVIGTTSGGSFSLEDAAGYPLVQSEGPLPLWIGGQAGEIGRSFYGPIGDEGAFGLIADGSLNATRVLNDDGRELVRADVGRAVDDQLAAGASPEDVPDLFYLLQRMAGWAAVGFGSVEYGKGDSLSPLWSRGMLPHELGGTASGRAGGRFPIDTLAALSPELATVEYAPVGGAPGKTDLSGVRELASRATAEQGSHPALRVLDLDRVENLLALDPEGYDVRDVRALWRLASVFGGPSAAVAE